MSVLKSKRGESKAQYVDTARRIKVEVRNFLSRLSARYARLDAVYIMALAREVADCTEKANSTTPVDEMRYNYRKENLLRARGALAALDANMLDVYETLMMNPAGAFSKRNGNDVKAVDAERRLSNMADRLGTMIDDETRLLNAVMKSDKEQLKKKK